MGGLRTLLPGAASALVLSGALAAAQEADLRWFADCTGRLSAEMEHQWLLSDPASDRTEQRRDEMWDLALAVMPEGAEAQAMGWRVQAKQAQAALLSQARFGTDPALAGQARARAATLAGQCTAALLG